MKREMSTPRGVLVGFRLTSNEAERLDVLAKKLGRTRSAAMRAILTTATDNFSISGKEAQR